MKNVFFILILFGASITSLWATEQLTPQPIKDIQAYITSQSQPVTAHDIAAYFSPQRTKATNTTTFGTANEFTASSVTGMGHVSIAALSNTTFVVAYTNASLHGTAIIGQVSGTTITYGSETVFNANSTLSISVAALSSTKFVVTYEDLNNSENGTAIVGQVSSGTTITYGTAKVFSTNTIAFTVVAALSSTDFVVAYREDNNSFRGVAVVGQVSGTTITNGSAVVFNANTTSFMSVTALSSSDFVIAYRDEGGTDAGIAVVGQVSSGTTITYGTAATFDTDLSYAISVAALTSSSFIVSYADNGNSAYGTAIIGQVSSGTTITYGTAQVFKSLPVFMQPPSIAVMSSTQVVIIYSISHSSNLRVGEAIVGTISGNSISFGTAEQFASKTDNPVITQLTNDLIGPPTSQTTDYVIAYDDFADMGHGYARFGDATMALPVELTKFIGTRTEQGILLNWQTASEVNNEGFEVQRSTNGEDWETIDFVEGRGTIQEVQNYTYIDKTALEGINYYRLKQFDFDGTYAYSSVISVEVRSKQTSLNIFPNPVNDELTIIGGEGIAIIYNALGQAVKEFSILNTQFVVNTMDLPKGQYILHITRQNGTTLTQQFIK